jgi:hypothetical protein
MRNLGVMQKKRVRPTANIRVTAPKPVPVGRPVGMQTMGTAVYAQIRLALHELGLAQAR